ncbi:MAG: tetratricopeptide repeat protein [Acidobacteriota bacterium]|nr:tetratricopeptide repeat protein [Acidobacteriota bacterium]
MRAPCLIALLALPCSAYDLTGRVEPPGTYAVFLNGASTPFAASTQSDDAGRFEFRKLAEGAYTLVLSTSARGELRRTIELGPGTADSHGRLKITVRIDNSRLQSDRARVSGATVSAKSLAIPEGALRQYEEAQRCLSRRDSNCAVKRLNRATRLAPRFAAAWNQLGTIAYQTAHYDEAEADFRRALDGDSESYEPLVNLGGVLLNLGRPEEALEYNKRAVLRRPSDALANSQLGLTYLKLNRLGPAEQYLKTAIELDRAHFSYPQLALANIYLARGDRQAAAGTLRDFLAQHPDAPEAARVRTAIEELTH